MKIFDRQKLQEANIKLFKNHNITTKNVIFIYTPIKVGSTTLVTSLRISAIDHFVIFHVHDEDCLKVLTGINDVTINDLILYNSLIGKNIYVIDVYRSPIERKISTFFELIEMHFNNSEEEINQYHFERINNRFNNIFLHIANEDYTKELYDITTPECFDFEKKYLFIKKNNINYIKLRLKDSQQWGNILTFLLGKEIVIINDYETNNKKINTLYANFKTNYRIPYNLLEEIKNDDYLNYYYSKEEKDIYINDWSQKICDSVIVYSKSEYELYFKITIENRKKFYIQFNHYMDSGCKCKLCDIKRKNIFERAKKGEEIKEKINHEELIEKNLINKKRIIKRIVDNGKITIESKRKMQMLMSKNHK
jgi:hypothetical protein